MKKLMSGIVEIVMVGLIIASSLYRVTNTVCEKNLAKIKNGMSVGEVETLLGVAEGDYCGEIGVLLIPDEQAASRGVKAAVARGAGRQHAVHHVHAERDVVHDLFRLPDSH